MVMKRGTVLFAIILLIAGLGWAQQPAAAPAAGAPAQVAAKSPVPDGTVAKVEVKQDVETKKAKVGDAVKIEVVEDGKGEDGKTALGPDGKPAVPRKTKLVGRVTSVQAGKPASLSLFVTTATFPNGKAMPFPAVVMRPFKVSNLSSGTGIDMGGVRPGARDANADTGAPEVASGIQGVDVKIDPQLGTVLIAPLNFALENGTQFYVRYVDPALHSTQAQQPPKK
jgi:hypothetical protein